MEKKGLLFIYNPNAGKGMIPRYLDEVTDIFEKAGYFVGLYRTQKPGDGTRQVLENAENRESLILGAGSSSRPCYPTV